jgi:hypothetical protein
MKKTLSRCLALASVLALASSAQFNNVLNVQSIPPVSVRAGGEVEVKARVRLSANYHVNSHTPSDEFLIPLRLTWNSAPLEVSAIEFPKPHLEKYAFSEKPLSVFTGDFDITTRFKAPASAPKGQQTVTGKLRYQACSRTACLPPRSVEVSFQANVY